MKQFFVILLFSLVSLVAFGQMDCECDSADIAYISAFKENVENSMRNVEMEFVLWDGFDNSYGSENYIKRRLVKDEVNELFDNGIIKSVTYYGKKRKDCLTILTYEIDSQVLFEIHLVKIGNKLCEELVFGEKEKFISSIAKSKERLLNAP